MKKVVWFVAISGGSGSGKTTAAHSLRNLLGHEYCRILSQDSYYYDHSQSFKGDGSVNFDHPDAIDFSLMAAHLSLLKNQKAIKVPIYDFLTHSRRKKTFWLQPAKFILVDGTLVLSQKRLREFFDISLFLNFPENLRYSRRLQRDVQERGREPEGVRLQFYSFVKPMHELFVQPSQVFASHVISEQDSVEKTIINLSNFLKDKI
jgi:uridine kinase